MPFSVFWMQIEIIILSEVSQTERQMCNITYMRNLKYGTNEPVYKTDSQTRRTDLWLPRGRGGWGRMD